MNRSAMLKIETLILLIALLSCSVTSIQAKIDRHAVVLRHSVLIESPDTLASLSVGNGEFAFTTDITGLQTFYREYENGVTLGTQSNWGWHYPMVTMCATRLNELEIALDALLKEVLKNTYLKNGHNYQSNRLRIYLPGNGGLLKAVSLMCAGWEGCMVQNPGFPKDGQWKVKWEGLVKDF